jgi:hypothetical protein
VRNCDVEIPFAQVLVKKGELVIGGSGHHVYRRGRLLKMEG